MGTQGRKVTRSEVASVVAEVCMRTPQRTERLEGNKKTPNAAASGGWESLGSFVHITSSSPHNILCTQDASSSVHHFSVTQPITEAREPFDVLFSSVLRQGLMSSRSGKPGTQDLPAPIPASCELFKLGTEIVAWSPYPLALPTPLRTVDLMPLFPPPAHVCSCCASWSLVPFLPPRAPAGSSSVPGS